MKTLQDCETRLWDLFYQRCKEDLTSGDVGADINPSSALHVEMLLVALSRQSLPLPSAIYLEWIGSVTCEWAIPYITVRMPSMDLRYGHILTRKPCDAPVLDFDVAMRGWPEAICDWLRQLAA